LKIILEALSYNPTTKTASNARYKELFLKHIRNLSISRVDANKIYQKLIEIYPPKPVKVWRMPTKIQTEGEAKRYFRIIDSVSSSLLPGLITIYFLRKKL